MMAMSLADRPRPALLQVRSILKGQLFTFVWLPREELTTARRTAIAMLLENEVGPRDHQLVGRAWRRRPRADPLHPIYRRGRAAARRRGARRRGRRDGPRLGAGGRGRADRGGRRAARDAPRADLHRRLPRRLSRAHRARGRRRRHPAAVRARRRRRPRRAHLAARRATRPASCGSRPIAAAALIPLSEAVPVLENFGFRVLEEFPTALSGGIGYIHDFRVEVARRGRHRRDPRARRRDRARDRQRPVRRGRGRRVQPARALRRRSTRRPVVWLRAWFRYLRQTGSSFGLVTVVDALRRAPNATRALIGLFVAAHDPAAKGREAQVDKYRERARPHRSPRSARSTTTASCGGCARWSRRSSAPTPSRRRPRKRSPSRSTRRWFRAFRAPVPWREIWVYSPRVEGIHLRGGPVARGGLRWSDRRDDFRTEILGLMKAQLVKNAVIVPTGAKGGFYPKQLPPMSNRDAWLAEGTESYRIFIRSLLSVTDNLVNDKVVHPEQRRHPRRRRSLFRGRRRQGHGDLLRHRQRDRARAQLLARRRLRQRRLATATTTRRWGSPPRARGSRSSATSSKWASTFSPTRSRVAGCGDMSGDVFGNGMLLSKAIKLVAAFDHRHIFIDPDPDPATSWEERKRMFELPRSSWDDYDRKLISQGRRRLPAHREVDRAQRRSARGARHRRQDARPGDA